MQSRLEKRFYTTVSTFSADLAHIFTTEIGVQPVGDTAELQMQISGRAPELSLEQREKRKLAKRIIKVIQPSLEDAIRKESELSGQPFEKELKELDAIFESGVLSRRVSLMEANMDRGPKSNGAARSDKNETTDSAKLEPKAEVMNDAVAEQTADLDGQGARNLEESSAQELNRDEASVNVSAALPTPEAANGNIEPTETISDVTNVNDALEKDNYRVSSKPPQQFLTPANGPLTPPLSFQGDQQQAPFAQGGIQWYMQPFDPIGTTIHEERWTGRDVMRGMSEELSELDEDELQGLVDSGADDDFGLSNGTTSDTAKGSTTEPVKVHRTRRWRGFK